MVDYGLEIIEREVRSMLINELNRCGFLFRLHSRIKDQVSIDEKKIRKSYGNGRKMQDVIGFRITTYFSDDLHVIVDLCRELFNMEELVYDLPDAEVFKPLRKNMICRMGGEQLKIFEQTFSNSNLLDIVDGTFEIQFRTTLSEGWHEVDHSLRYKCKEDWNNLNLESRMLNGIYATLETNDQALVALFDDIAFRHYKSRKWEAMIRNKFRIRFVLKEMDQKLIEVFDSDAEIGRSFFKLNRGEVIDSYVKSNLVFPISFDFLIFYINYFFIRNRQISSLTPSILIERFQVANEEYQLIRI